MSRHNADYSVGFAFEANCLPENAAIAREDSLPEFIAENDGVGTLGAIFFRRKGSAQPGPEAHHVEESSGDAVLMNVADPIAGFHVHAVGVKREGRRLHGRNMIANQFPGLAILTVIRFFHRLSPEGARPMAGRTPPTPRRAESGGSAHS